MYTQNNVLRVFVGKNVNSTSNGTVIDHYSDLSDGAIAVVDESNTVQTTSLASVKKFRFVWRNGVNLIYSPFMKVGNIVKYYTRGWSIPKEQISYVGWNGTNGSIELQNSKLYILRIVPLDSFKTFGNKVHYKISSYKSDSAATQAEVADGLLDDLFDQFKHESEVTMKFERTAAGTSLAALTGSAVIYKFTKDSTSVATYIKAADGTAALTASTASVTAADVIQTPSTSAYQFTFDAVALGNSAGHTLVFINDTSYLVNDAGSDAQNATAIVAAINAGDLATATASTAAVTVTMRNGVQGCMMVLKSDDDSTWTNVVVTPSDTVPVIYRAAATTSSAATFTLDQPWQGPTCYFYEGTTVGKNVGVLTATGAYGIKCTGVARTNFVPGVFKYMKNRFKLLMTVDGVSSTTTITYSQVANEGQGTYEQIAELEWFASGNFINYAKRVAEPGDDTMRATAVSTTRYETIVLHVYDDNDVATLTGASPKSVHEIILAYHKDSGQGDDMITTLNTTLAPDLSTFPA